MTEIWKDIKGHEGVHQVSNLGNIRSIDHIDKYHRHRKGKILKPRPIKKGYLLVTFRNYKPLYVHRAVAMAFVPGYFNGAEVNHKDENKSNNKWDNLEWVTPYQNVNYGTRNQRHRETMEKIRGVIVEMYKDDILIKTFPSITSAGKEIGVSRQAVYHGIKHNHLVKGYSFKLPPS